MKTRQIRIRKRSTLLLSLLVGAVLSLPGVANATNGAQFTSLSAEYVELDLDPEDFEGTEDDDGHADDLLVTFTETGTGNSKVMDITVTAVREITVTCISAEGTQIVLQTEEPIALRFPDESSEVSATFASDDNGALTSTIPLRTSLGGYLKRSFDEESGEYNDEWERGDVCPTLEESPGLYVLKDYTVTYTDLTVTDNENGGASASIDRVESVPGDPGYCPDAGYCSDDIVVEVGGGDMLGFTCTIHDDLSGNCHSS